jgi:magnesium transporter
VVSGARSIPVVDAGGRFQSLVPPDRLLRVLEREHDEDLARMGGFLAGASAARAASHEVVLRRLWHRLPWLALGLVGAMTSPLIVGVRGGDPKTGLARLFRAGGRLQG